MSEQFRPTQNSDRLVYQTFLRNFMEAVGKFELKESLTAREALKNAQRTKTHVSTEPCDL